VDREPLKTSTLKKNSLKKLVIANRVIRGHAEQPNAKCGEAISAR
jgi:hypothetical protein